ncbi:Hypothetical predicted protein [Mytilus galloprovincialis]|uniref:Uncharacterized protein n=1 Tax=Mytilus galloprovincialis TaxID=29158 RepID=A0A8B6C7G9_MYTGA|nr:Hypothetical predicted protein [Mytilus galloprovincialis]
MELLSLLCTAVTFVLEIVVASGSNNIYKDVFQNYAKELVPTWNVPTPLKLSFNAAPSTIVSFTELEEKLTLTMSVTVNWTDHRLGWNPTLYNNTYTLTIPPHDIWLPYLYLANSVNDVKPIGEEADFYVILVADGTVYWTPGGVFEAQCTPDVSKFPFDTQFCLFLFTMWGILPGDVEFSVYSKVPNLSYFAANSDWTVIDTFQNASLIGVDSSAFVVGISIKRKPIYYVVTVILPTLLFCLMNPLIFCLPVESGERISLGMTILLAYAIFLTIVSASIPAKSDPLCTILLALVCIMMVSGVIVILTIISAYYYYMEDVSHANPCLRRLTLRFNRKQKDKTNLEENKDTNSNSLSGSNLTGKDLSNTLDIIFCVISFVIFIGILFAYFLYILIS